MKNLIAAIYTAELMASGIGLAKASSDTMTTTVKQTAHPTSEQFFSLDQPSMKGRPSSR